MHIKIILLWTTIYLISLRGFFSLFANNIYLITALLLFLISMIGFYKLNQCKSHPCIPDKLRKILYINFILMGCHGLIELTISFESSIQILSTFLVLGCAPFALGVLTSLSESSIRTFLIVTTVLTSLSVIYDFLLLNDMFSFDGYESVLARYQLIRPDLDFTGLSKSNNLFRPMGFSPPLPHNSAQVNATLAGYWFMYLFNTNTKRYLLCGLFLLSFVACIFSLVVSVNIAMFLGLFIGCILLLSLHIRNFRRLSYFFLLVTLIIYYIISSYDTDYIYKILQALILRADPSTGDWENMLDFRVLAFWPDLFSFLLGSYSNSEYGLHSMEITFVSLVFTYSIFGATIYFYFLTFPIVMYMVGRINKLAKSKYSPEVVALLIAIITLWHYSSLLQAGNIMIFMVIYASCLNGMNKTKQLQNKLSD